MKILVTGATGFIGAAVARQLSQQHHEVLALSRSDAAAAKLRVAGLTPVAGDFAVPASLAAPAASSWCSPWRMFAGTATSIIFGSGRRRLAISAA